MSLSYLFEKIISKNSTAKNCLKKKWSTADRASSPN